MKNLPKLILIAFTFISIFGFCKKSKTYITVGYSSICCGTPSEKPLMDYILKFEKENKVQPFEVFVEYGLGREGEHNYYIRATNLSSKLFNSFWDGLKTAASTQNKQRAENHDGYVNVNDALLTNADLQKIKTAKKANTSMFKLYDYHN